MSRLEAVPDNRKDWLPGSNGTFLDIVDPSLFPLMYGKSKFLRDGKVPLETCSDYSGRGETVPVVTYPPPVQLIGYVTRSMIQEHNRERERDIYSSKHQWLPCDVAVDWATSDARITSYINNLNPDGNQDLYAAIEQVISKALPMWQMAVRSTIFQFTECKVPVVGDGFDEEENLLQDEINERWERKYDEEHAKGNIFWGTDGLVSEGEDMYPPGRNKDDHVLIPEPEPYKRRVRVANKSGNEMYRKTFSGNKLQVIVKLANIMLTPDEPSYDGDSWHIEVRGLVQSHALSTAS